MHMAVGIVKANWNVSSVDFHLAQFQNKSICSSFWQYIFLSYKGVNGGYN